jgi:NAD(P)-dependent dehydrogenase (short-subunit alcohol dehydrogenase family)
LDIRLDDKVAVVTGAASGIGLACAGLLAESGARVALADIRDDALAKATKKVSERGVARGYRLDVTDIPQIAPAIARIRGEMGEMDILVCCAGINVPALAHEVAEADWDAVNAVNAKGLFFCNQAVAVQSMIPRQSGAIVNIASIAGLVGYERFVAYSASKGAVVQLTRTEALDWAPYSIRINVVAPTSVLTNLTRNHLSKPGVKERVLDKTPFHRLATVDEIAKAVCFLVSDAASMITGAVLPVDGGWTAQ